MPNTTSQQIHRCYVRLSMRDTTLPLSSKLRVLTTMQLARKNWFVYF